MNEKQEVERLNKILDKMDNYRCDGCNKHFHEDDLLCCDHCDNICCKDCTEEWFEGSSTEDGFQHDDFAICKSCAERQKRTQKGLKDE